MVKPTTKDLVHQAFNSRYWSGVNYDYDKDCSGCTDDTYHRHCIIINFHITNVNVPVASKEVWEQADPDPILRYCIDRIITKSELWDSEKWTTSVSQGYYGQELDGVEFTGTTEVNREIDRIWDLNSTQKIQAVLEKEYGYLIDRVKNATCAQIRNVKSSVLNFPNQEYSKKLEIEIVESYANSMKKGQYGLPIGIFYEVGNKYNVIDGYHRLMAATLVWQNDPTKTFDIIVVR